MRDAYAVQVLVLETLLGDELEVVAGPSEAREVLLTTKSSEPFTQP